MVVFLTLNISRKFRTRVYSPSQWNVSVVSIFWVILGYVMLSSEVFDDKGLHKNKKCVFFNFLWYRNVRVGRCSISLLICSFRFHSNCWENTVYGNHSAFSKNYQLLAYTLLGLSDAVVKLLNIAFCFWHLPPRDHNPFSWNITKFSWTIVEYFMQFIDSRSHKAVKVRLSPSKIFVLLTWLKTL